MIFEPLLHIAQPDPSQGIFMGVEAVRVKAFAIVANRQKDGSTRRRQLDAHLTGIGMAINIGQGFLGNAKQGCFGIVREQVSKSHCLDFNLYARAFRKIIGEAFKGWGEAQIIQGAGTQIARNPAHFGDCHIEALSAFLDGEVSAFILVSDFSEGQFEGIFSQTQEFG